MKISEENIDRAVMFLPSFLILLTCRTVSESAKYSNLEPPMFVQAVESFLFSLINMADADAMEKNQFSKNEYVLRRSQVLKSLGLVEYAQEAMLIPVENMQSDN